MFREDKIRRTFEKTKEELDDHLDAINQNTNEIQANYEYIRKLECKIEKLNEKLDELLMCAEEFDVDEIKLSSSEKELFLVLYTSEDFMGYSEIAEKLNVSAFLVGRYCTNLLEKGIPVIKKFVDNKAQVKIEAWFKELQAKENILNIE